MPELLLTLPHGYDRDSQPTVALFAVQLDDQLRRLKETVRGLSVEALEWQSAPGMNTIGMLLAHLALVEVRWIQGFGLFDTHAEYDAFGAEKLSVGRDVDGIPLAPDGTHPTGLSGWTLERYLELMDRARALVHERLRALHDADLDETFTSEGYTFSWRWVLYHVLEHFAAHFGQIGLIRHQVRDAGLIE